MSDDNDSDDGGYDALFQAEAACDDDVRVYNESLAPEVLGSRWFDQRLGSLHNGIDIAAGRSFFADPRRKDTRPSDIPRPSSIACNSKQNGPDYPSSGYQECEPPPGVLQEPREQRQNPPLYFWKLQLVSCPARYQSWESLHVAEINRRQVQRFDRVWNYLSNRIIQNLHPNLAPLVPARRSTSGGAPADGRHGRLKDNEIQKKMSKTVDYSIEYLQMISAVPCDFEQQISEAFASFEAFLHRDFIVSLVQHCDTVEFLFPLRCLERQQRPFKNIRLNMYTETPKNHGDFTVQVIVSEGAETSREGAEIEVAHAMAACLPPYGLGVPKESVQLYCSNGR